jgi:hypothetical protein
LYDAKRFSEHNVEVENNPYGIRLSGFDSENDAIVHVPCELDLPHASDGDFFAESVLDADFNASLEEVSPISSNESTLKDFSAEEVQWLNQFLQDSPSPV